MKKQKIIYQIFGVVMGVFVMTTLPSCDDDDETDDATTEEEMSNWEPYDLKSNTAYDYNFEKTSEENVSSPGTAHIKVGDPEVEISGNFDGKPFSHSYKETKDISENFITAVSMTPMADFMYQPMWTDAFANQEIRVGTSWTHSYGGNSVSFNVTGKDTYAGFEGFVMETTIQEAESGETVEWISCITSELPIPLMTKVIYNDGEEYYMEITDYEEE